MFPSDRKVFPSASNVSVYLNGYHIDLAYRIDYKESAPKVPIYGYNDVTYNTVARSKSVIQGFIIVNFMFPYYLGAAIDASLNVQSGESLALENEIDNELPPNLSAEDKVQRAEYIAALIEDPLLRNATIQKLNEKFFTQNKKNYSRAGVTRTSKSSPLFSDFSLKGSTIDVYFDDPVKAKWIVRFSNVHFTEVSQQASQAGAEGSSEPLYEVYSFIASSKNTVLLG